MNRFEENVVMILLFVCQTTLQIHSSSEHWIFIFLLSLPIYDYNCNFNQAQLG